jgi:hypothetical protein
MRTKTLLLAVAALAAGIISSEAQNVYSQNIVGYVNTVSTAGTFNLIANPLDDGTNTVVDLFPSPAVGTIVETWNGASFTQAKYKASGWTTNLLLYPGTGFFLDYAGSGSITNTFVGNVVVQQPNGVDGLGTNNTAITAGFILLGSPFPISDTLTGTNINLGPSLQVVGNIVETWNGASYVQAKYKASGWTTNLNLGVGQGFFVSAAATNWQQILP